MFRYSDTNKRYHSLDYAFKQKYGCKVAKICIDANYTCINRDGIKGNEGCSFCLGRQQQPVEFQLQVTQQQAIIKNKWPNAKYQLYFQNYSNTYATLETNIKNYQLYTHIPDVVSLAIATRVDSISLETLEYLDSLSKNIDIQIELGLQTIYDATREQLNCHYSLQNFQDCITKVAKTNCSIVVHIINGLPNESPDMMLNTVKYLNQLPINGLKIHMLHIDSQTPLAITYQATPYPLLSLDEYTDITIQQLTHLLPEIVIHRLTGDPFKDQLITPAWTLDKIRILNTIDKKMAQSALYQGMHVSS